RFPRFVRNRNPVTSRWELIPHAEAANHAALSELVLGPWLLSARWRGGDVLAALSKPPWDTSRPGFALAVPPEKAIPESALVFLTSRFRWPHLGMSLFRRAKERDTAIAYVDALYDQALRAQDMRRPDRAVSFAQRLYEKVPGPQSAATLAEAYRMANDTASLSRLVDTLPPAQKSAPEFGLVLALYLRDAGALDQAAYVLSEVFKVAPRPEIRKLTAVAPAAWPSSVREITRPAVEGLPAAR
ncbi:MAG TPA: hypothetical protein VGR00_03240, partial [Thermoanaerobaculia bacterium]|nr:hypothetical protein [Thermoanaerobaculia bacterium]